MEGINTHNVIDLDADPDEEEDNPPKQEPDQKKYASFPSQSPTPVPAPNPQMMMSPDAVPKVDTNYSIDYASFGMEHPDEENVHSKMPRMTLEKNLKTNLNQIEFVEQKAKSAKVSFGGGENI